MKLIDSKKRAGIWIRVSTDMQVKEESPEHHERRARLYAEAKGWEVIEVYRLDAMSGKTVKDYPETTRMLDDIRTGHITGLIFSKLARLARNTKELLEFAEIFRECNADLISLAESIDTSTPAGRLFYTMVAAMAQWEREEIASRVAASVPIRAQMGKPLGGQAPFGYQWKEGELIPHPDEAPIRKLLHELFKEHKRKKTVARILNERGFRTRNGAKFSDTTVGRLIQDPTAKGMRRANYTQSTNNKKAWTMKPEHEWVHHDVPAIISEELWTECAAILEGRKGSRKQVTKQVRHLFSGLTFCECGTKMYVPSNQSNKYVCQQCRNKIPVIDLEAIFHEQLKNFFFSSEEVNRHFSEFEEVIKRKEALFAIQEKERKKLETELDKLYALYQADAIDKKGFAEKYKPLQARQAELDDEMPALQAEVDFLKITQLSQGEIISEARDLYSRWLDLPHDEKRRIVEAITENIIIGEGEVEINLFYAPPIPGRNTDTSGGEGGGADDYGSGEGGPHKPPSPLHYGERATQQQGFMAATS
jgi:site-specific DNA recombinase